MEIENYKCSSCSAIFSYSLIPYELPCFHSYCYKCLKTLYNNDLCSCLLDKNKFQISIEKIAIANFYLNFVHPLNNEQKIICNYHQNKKIKCFHLEKRELICSLCIIELEYYRKGDYKNYLNKEFIEDLQIIEKNLKTLQINIQDQLNKINEFRNNKINNSLEIKKFLDQEIKFFTNPIVDNLNLNFLSLTSDIFSKSKILNNHPNRLFIEKCFQGKRIKELIMLIRGSENDFKTSIFHQLCDNKSSTLIIIKALNTKKVFGGYRKSCWTHNNAIPSEDKESFLFQLDKQTQHFQTKNSSSRNPLWQNGRNYGIMEPSALSFGNNENGKLDIFISNNCNRNTQSYATLGYMFSLPANIQVGSQEALNYMAGTSNFSIEEYEIFSVILD